MSTEALPFTLTLVQSEEDLADVRALRAEAYGRHLPQLRDALLAFDPSDVAPNAAVLLCRDKATGAVVATARIMTSFGCMLQLEACVPLPPEIVEAPRAEVTRLAVARQACGPVKAALFKGVYLFALANQLRWVVLGARSQALCRQYRGIGFTNVFDDERAFPLDYAGGLPHFVMGSNMPTAAARSLRDDPNLYRFMVETFHPDIELFPTRSNLLGRPTAAGIIETRV